MIDILRKTWRKMSDRGRAAALALDLPARERALIEKALSPGAGAGPEGPGSMGDERP